MALSNGKMRDTSEGSKSGQIGKIRVRILAFYDTLLC